MTPTIKAVFKSNTHTMFKLEQPSIKLLAGLGVEGDAHMGMTVKHRSRVAADPTQPNLRQVHLIHSELHDELLARGFHIKAGQMGENITTRGIALLELPKGTKMFLGETAILEITGLRNPCLQLEGFTLKLDRWVRTSPREALRFSSFPKAQKCSWARLPHSRLLVCEIPARNWMACKLV